MTYQLLKDWQIKIVAESKFRLSLEEWLHVATNAILLNFIVYSPIRHLLYPSLFWTIMAYGASFAALLVIASGVYSLCCWLRDRMPLPLWFLVGLWRIEKTLMTNNLLSKKEMHLIAFFLEKAADEFGNHGSNDMNGELNIFGFTPEEKIAISKEYIEYNCPNVEERKEYIPSVKEFDRIPDYAWMGFLAKKLKRNS